MYLDNKYCCGYFKPLPESGNHSKIMADEIETMLYLPKHSDKEREVIK